MDGRAEVGATGRPGGHLPVRRWRAVCRAVLLVLLVTWFVLDIFVLDVVVADAVSLAAVVAVLAGAAWRARKRKKAHPVMWLGASLSIAMPFTLLHDFGTEHRWPAGQMHELLIARRIGMVPTLACLALFCIAFARQRRAATATAGREPTAT